LTKYNIVGKVTLMEKSRIYQQKDQVKKFQKLLKKKFGFLVFSRKRAIFQDRFGSFTEFFFRVRAISKYKTRFFDFYGFFFADFWIFHKKKSVTLDKKNIRNGLLLLFYYDENLVYGRSGNGLALTIFCNLTQPFFHEGK